MSRRHAPTLDLVRNAGKLKRHLSLKPSRRRPFGLAAPPCFISALALSLIIGSGAAAGQGGCDATGSNLTCTGTVSNPSAFTPSSDFTVDVGTTTPTDVTADITQDSGFAGIKINAGNFGGTVSMTTGSTISVEAGSGSSRNGMVLASQASGTSKTYTLDIDGSITSAAAEGDALRLEGTSSAIFNATIGRNAHLGGGTGDDSVMVTGAQSLLLKNYGILEGGSGQPTTGGEGINVGNGTRIAADGVTINNHGTITGTGNAGINGGQGVSVFGDGDVTITNSRHGDITGTSQGIRVEADGMVSITNDGHIQGNSKSGVEIADATIANVTNRSSHTISGATDGLYVHDVDAADVDNDHGHIVGHDGDGVHLDNIDGNVTVKNCFGFGWNAATIEGSDNGLAMTDVDGNIAVDNRFGGKIIGHDDNGILAHDTNGRVTIDNSQSGAISGHDDGVHVNDTRHDVTIDNSSGGRITGWRDDGVDVGDARDDVTISNNFGGRISGHDNGVQVRDVRDDVTISNNFGGEITGRDGAGVDIDHVRDDVSISNIAGEITGGEQGIDVSNVGDDLRIDNAFGGRISGYGGDGIRADNIDGQVDIDNALFGRVSGHDDGIHVSDVNDHVAINNSYGGSVTGWRDDGIDVSDVDDDVRVDNRFGGSIAGRDNGVQIRDVHDDVTISNGYGGQITGRDGNGVDVSNVRDDVTLDNRNGGSVAGDDAGAKIENIRGDVTIANDRGGISGRHDSGIDVSNVRGDVRVGNANGAISGGDDGARIEDVHGDVALYNWSGTIEGHDDGVHVRDVHDDVTISNSFGGTITGRHEDGIDIRDVDDDVEISNSFGGSVTGHDSGIKVTDIGDDVRIDNRFGGDITGRDDGVKIEDAGDDVSIKNSFGGSIAASRGDGVDVRDVSDDVQIDNRFGGRIAGRDNGVKVRGVGDDVSIANSFGGKIRAYVGDGVNIKGVGGDVRIGNEIGGSIEGRDDGIKVDHVDGGVTVDNNYGVIRGRNDAGVDISADGAVTVNNGAGSIRGRTNAIAIDADTAEINSSGLIRGSGIFNPTILLSTENGATLNNNKGGLIRGFRSDPEDFAVEMHGGAVTINNAGTIIGRVDLSDAGNTDTPNTFNNSSNNSWHVLGTSQLGNGLADTFNNTGTIYTTDPDHPADNNLTELAGVEYFNNGGLGGAGTIELQDGYTGDVFALSPTSGGTLLFNGAAGQSALKVDSFLSTTSNSASDSLVIDGNVTGSTAIYVNNVNSGFGGFNPTGIGVVNATGSLPAGSFYLANGPINTGMFTYDLYLNGPNDVVLASAPNHIFFELPTLTSAAQSIWHSAAGAWLDRTADLRAALEGTCDVGSLKDPSVGCTKPTSGIWAKVLGSSESRSTDHAFAVLNTVQRHTVDTQLDGGGVIGGYDVIRSTDDGTGIWMAGVMGGYLRSTLNFDSSVTDAKFEGGAVGGYVTYLRGGWFLDGQVLANLGNVKYSGSLSEKDHANVTSIGGVLDTGYRMAYGPTFIEPGATLSYVNANIDNLALYGTSVNFTNGDSLRGRLGMRLGTTVVREQAKYEPFIGVSALYEFLGDNTADVTSGNYVLKATDNLTGALGEVSGGVNVFSLAGDGLTAFAKGDVQFGKDEFVGYGGTLGVRVDW